MKDKLRNMDKSAGTLELIEDGRIKYYMVLDNHKEFFLTTMEAPVVKNDTKYTNIYYKKNKWKTC